MFGTERRRHYLATGGRLSERAYLPRPRAERCEVRARLLGGLVWMTPTQWSRWPVEHRDAYLAVVDGPVDEDGAPVVLADLCRAGFAVRLGANA